ncbi:MAG: hypothetical protein J6A58_06185 [Oscillospiraceae bacterium]|nr:hypothetical protein [Oscillospiraceae bacterium]
MAKKNNKNKYSPGRKREKDPMLWIMCIFGVAVLVSLPFINNLVTGTEPQAVKAPGWHMNEGEMYYIDPQTNEKAVGLQTIGTDKYYFDHDGGVTAGWAQHDGKTFYVNKNGKISVGVCNIGTDVYCFDEVTLDMITGFFSDNNATYYFADNGKAQKGFVTIEENDYYFDGRGVMQIGWFKTSEGSSKNYYADDNGHLHSGWITLDDGKHYLNEDYSAASGVTEVDGKEYNFDAYGKEIVADVTEDPEVTDVPEQITDVTTTPATEAIVNGWTDKGKYMVDGNPLVGIHELEGKRYAFGEDGVPMNGFFTFENDTYYANPGGVLLIGFCGIGYDKYMFDSNGKMLTGFQTVNGLKCYFRADGKMAHGFEVVDGCTYYFGWEDGTPRTGYVAVKGDRYYFNEQGIMISGFVSLGEDATYYFGPDGKGVTGYHTIDGERYFFNEDGLLLTGFIEMNGTIYHFGSGPIHAGEYNYNGTIYGFDENGQMIYEVGPAE